MDKRAMFENRVVQHGTVCFICTPILWNLSTCHVSWCKNSSSASILERVTRLQKASVYEWRTRVARRKLRIKQSLLRTIYRVLLLLTPWIPTRFPRWSGGFCDAEFHLVVYEMLVSIVVFYRDHLESYLLSGSLGKQCKETEFSFAHVLRRRNTSISRHFDTQHIYL